MASPLRLFNPAFLQLTAGHGLQAVGYSTMLLFPLHLERLGASRTAIGLLTALSGLSGLLTRPLVARALEVHGSRRVIAVSTLLLALSLAMASLVDGLGLLVAAQRVLFGASVGALFTAYFKAAADWIPAPERTRGIALFGLSGIVPLVVLPFVDQLATALSVPISHVYPAAAALVLLSGLVAWPVRDRPPAPDPLASSRNDHAGPAPARSPARPVWVATAAFSCMVSVFMAFSTVSAARAGHASPAVLWLWYALGAALVRTLGAGLPDRVGPPRLVIPAFTAYVIGLVGLSLARSETTLALTALIAGVGHGYGFPVLMGLVVSRASEAARARAVATYTAIWGALELIAPPLFGLVADALGDPLMFALAGASGVVGGLAWLALERPDPRRDAG